jgi:hypothetical protein
MHRTSITKLAALLQLPVQVFGNQRVVERAALLDKLLLELVGVEVLAQVLSLDVAPMGTVVLDKVGRAANLAAGLVRVPAGVRR